MNIRIIQNAGWTAVYKNNKLYAFNQKLCFETDVDKKYINYLRNIGIKHMIKIDNCNDYIEYINDEGWFKISKHEAINKLNGCRCSWTCYKDLFKSEDYIDNFNIDYFIFNCDVNEYNPPLYFSEFLGYLKNNYNLEEQYGFLSNNQKQEAINEWYEFIKRNENNNIIINN